METQNASKEELVETIDELTEKKKELTEKVRKT